MHGHVSTRKLARAIEVSESSVKRWCDQGVINSFRTAGGHRRIRVSDVIAFLREGHYDLVRPELLGLPATVGRSGRTRDRSQHRLRDALLAGDEEQSRRIIVDLFLADHELASIFDEVVAPTFHDIGALWTCGEAEIYQERRACEICQRVLLELRTMLPVPLSEAPLAMGGTPEGDTYRLPNTMVDLVLLSRGWETHNLGAGLPFETLTAAIRRHRPQLFWLSVSDVPDPRQFSEGVARLMSDAARTRFVVGGRGVTDELRQALREVAFIATLGELARLSTDLRERGRSGNRRTPASPSERVTAGSPNAGQRRVAIAEPAGARHAAGMPVS